MGGLVRGWWEGGWGVNGRVVGGWWEDGGRVLEGWWKDDGKVDGRMNERM